MITSRHKCGLINYVRAYVAIEEEVVFSSVRLSLDFFSIPIPTPGISKFHLHDNFWDSPCVSCCVYWKILGCFLSVSRRHRGQKSLGSYNTYSNTRNRLQTEKQRLTNNARSAEEEVVAE